MTPPRQPRRPAPYQSDWSPRPIPEPAPERRTADPETPTLRELAERERQRASLVATPAAAAPEPAAAQHPVRPLPAGGCTGGWDQVNAEAARAIGERPPRPGQPFIPAPDADVVERNRKVTAAYAQLFQQDDRFRWAGAAAFASKQVGCGMQDARAIAHSRFNPLSADAAQAEFMLGKGNAAVFSDIYPAHLFYREFGSRALATCGSARPGGEINPRLVTAFRRLDGEGSRPPTAHDLETSAQLIIDHEQTDVLQPQVFDNWLFGDNLFLNQQVRNVLPESAANALGARPVSVALSAACSGPVTYEFDGSAPASLSQRLPFAKQVVTEFGKAVEGPNRVYVEQEVAKLASGTWRYGR